MPETLGRKLLGTLTVNVTQGDGECFGTGGSLAGQCWPHAGISWVLGRHPPLLCAHPRAHSPRTPPFHPHPPHPPAVWAYQSKTTVKATEQETEDGTVKRSVGVARGQALAVNGLECFKEDCEEPVAQVGRGEGDGDGERRDQMCVGVAGCVARGVAACTGTACHAGIQ